VYLGRLADKSGKLLVFTISIIFSLFMVLIITNMPNVPFMVVLLFFAFWFMVATGRIVTAQAMISQVVPASQRGSFMSINGSIQQLGSGIAAMCAGAIVVTEPSGRIRNYEWVGYFSILVLIATLLYSRAIFGSLDKREMAKAVTPVEEDE
jgi:MFS family permease